MSVPAATTIRVTPMEPGRVRLDIAREPTATSYRVFRALAALAGITGTAATDLLSKTSHGLTAGDLVRFTSVDYASASTALPLDTDLYVLASGLTADAFKVALAPGGAAIDLDQNVTDAECDVWDLRETTAELRTYDTVTVGATVTYGVVAHNSDGDSALSAADHTHTAAAITATDPAPTGALLAARSRIARGG